MRNNEVTTRSLKLAQVLAAFTARYLETNLPDAVQTAFEEAAEAALEMEKMDWIYLLAAVGIRSYQDLMDVVGDYTWIGVVKNQDASVVLWGTPTSDGLMPWNFPNFDGDPPDQT